MIRLFELDTAGNVIATEHCHTIVWLKAIMDEYGKEDSIKAYAFIFYMTYILPRLY